MTWVLATSYVQADGAHSLNSGYGTPPEPNYGAPAPAPSYGVPTPSYGAPAPSYGAPAPSYETPSTGYGLVPTGYETTGYGEEEGFDFTPLIILMIGVIGLSLLFPTYVTIETPPVASANDNNGRKKRYAENGNDFNLFDIRALRGTVPYTQYCATRNGL